MTRLDIALYERNYAKSRSHAQNLIKLKRVSVNGVLQTKASAEIGRDAEIVILEGSDFASLGGLKLEAALRECKVNPSGKHAADIGASNGGFTDVLLRAGVSELYCVDVDDCRLPDSLREDPRVHILDRKNARYLTEKDFGSKLDLVTVDVSFISLTLLIPSLCEVLKEEGEILALIKPQFEVGRGALNKHGIVKNEKMTFAAIERVKHSFLQAGFSIRSVIRAPHPFEEKNQEYFLYAFRKSL